MVGYITVAHGAAQRLSEKWRHFACTSVVITFCTSPFCVGVVKSAERGLRVYDHRDGPHTRSIWWSAGPGPLRTRAGRLPAVGVAAAAVRPCAGS